MKIKPFQTFFPSLCPPGKVAATAGVAARFSGAVRPKQEKARMSMTMREPVSRLCERPTPVCACLVYVCTSRRGAACCVDVCHCGGWARGPGGPVPGEPTAKPIPGARLLRSAVLYRVRRSARRVSCLVTSVRCRVRRPVHLHDITAISLRCEIS